mmetsp:Transcript_54445/g.89835  ORF Transcript_54445/g.89835 Transcript_54445/m.89835 type:complete len:82 (-) Transcript_54445:342-587(-)
MARQVKQVMALERGRGCESLCILHCTNTTSNVLGPGLGPPCPCPDQRSPGLRLCIALAHGCRLEYLGVSVHLYMRRSAAEN